MKQPSSPASSSTHLLIAIDQKKLVLAGGKTGKSPHSLPLANFTLLLATTDEYKLISPLIDRMRLVLRFQFYGVEDLAEITRQRCQALQWPMDDEVLPLIAARSRGVPRWRSGLFKRLVVSLGRKAKPASCSITWNVPAP